MVTFPLVALDKLSFINRKEITGICFMFLGLRIHRQTGGMSHVLPESFVGLTQPVKDTYQT